MVQCRVIMLEKKEGDQDDDDEEHKLHEAP